MLTRLEISLKTLLKIVQEEGVGFWIEWYKLKMNHNKLNYQTTLATFYKNSNNYLKLPTACLLNESMTMPSNSLLGHHHQIFIRIATHTIRKMR